MSRGSQSHCWPKLCLSLPGQLVLPGWLQLFADRQALPARILAYLGTNTCLRRPNRYPGHWPMGFPDSWGPGNSNCSAHCAGPGNGSSRHSVRDLCARIIVIMVGTLPVIEASIPSLSENLFYLDKIERFVSQLID